MRTTKKVKCEKNDEQFALTNKSSKKKFDDLSTNQKNLNTFSQKASLNKKKIKKVNNEEKLTHDEIYILYDSDWLASQNMDNNDSKSIINPLNNATSNNILSKFGTDKIEQINSLILDVKDNIAIDNNVLPDTNINLNLNDKNFDEKVKDIVKTPNLVSHNLKSAVSSDTLKNDELISPMIDDIDSKCIDYRVNQHTKNDYDGLVSTFNNQNKLFSEQDNIMNNQISESELKGDVRHFTSTHETPSLINKHIDNDTQQINELNIELNNNPSNINSNINSVIPPTHLDLSKEMFDMNAFSQVAVIEVNEVSTNNINPVINAVEKMNDDTILTTQDTHIEVSGYAKIVEKKGIRIRSKDTSLSSQYAKEYAQTSEEFCCFNYTPPTKSISHFIFHNDLENLVKHIENQMGNETFDLNQRDETGETASWTALYWSVKLNKIDFVKFLLEQGADVNIVINDYNECCGTALDLAMLRGYDLMEKILKEHMEKDSSTAQKGFKNIRTKPRGKAPAFNFKYYGKKKRECQFSDDESVNTQDFNFNNKS